ncbi:hypothetical protein EUTSA_v10005417mg [Eutrema salsugineum]|uniref:RNase H type-1 domain-containing protein n=1 Tax=Eutrema salsugineum TaxID=72664 RepID=V4KTA4_EUTSA|nr:hypothetical protein EUTSA_v10005417mg [Eutrema salsugineum]
MWRIWKARNNMIFNKQRIKPCRDVAYVVADVDEWIKNLHTDTIFVHTGTLLDSSSKSTWNRPETGWVKCNYDAAFDPNTKWTLNFKFDSICFEWDSKVLVDILQGNREDFSILNLVDDINHWRSRFKHYSIVHVSRNLNEAAHLLAKKGPPNYMLYSDCIHPPHWLTNTLYADYMISN